MAMTSHGNAKTRFVAMLAVILAAPSLAAARGERATEYTPAQITALVAAAGDTSDRGRAEGRRRVGELRARLGLTEASVVALLQTLGQAHVPYEQLTQKLSELVKQ